MKDFPFRLFLKIVTSAVLIGLTIPGARVVPWWIGLFFAGLLSVLSRATIQSWLVPLWLSVLVLLGTNFASAGIGALLGASLALLWVPRFEGVESSIKVMADITLIAFIGFFQPFLYGYLPGHCLLALSVPLMFAFLPAPYGRVGSFLALIVEAVVLATNLELMFPAICGVVYGPAVARWLLGVAKARKSVKSASGAPVEGEK